MRVRLEDLRFGPNPPAGMNPLVLMAMAYRLRSTTEDLDPIEVTADGDGWRIHDGRHRAVAALIAGRPDVLAEAYDPGVSPGACSRSGDGPCTGHRSTAPRSSSASPLPQQQRSGDGQDGQQSGQVYRSGVTWSSVWTASKVNPQHGMTTQRTFSS